MILADKPAIGIFFATTIALGSLFIGRFFY